MPATERIGKYELVAHLAAGGMGQVYLARSAGPGGFERHVVIKTLDTDGIEADEDDAIAMFLDEARLVGLLHHHHIAPVYEVDRDGDRLYLVMDYVHGHTAHDVWVRALQARAALPLDFTLTVVAAAASGLHYAHTRRGADGRRLQIVHRDVTLSNLMIGFDGAVKLIDFGIAKAANRSTHTQVGFVKGKVGYMAPEQLRGHAVDARTDVFALGIVLYELSTMRRAFREESDRATMERIKSGQLVAPSTFLPDYPRGLERIVTRALRVDPRERYSDADALRREVEALGHGLGLMLGDAAVAEVMTQLFEDRREPWQPRAQTRVESELDVALEVVAAPIGDDATSPRRLRAATEAAEALIIELGNAPPASNGVPRRPRNAFDTEGVTIVPAPVRMDTEPSVPPSTGNDSDEVLRDARPRSDSTDGQDLTPAPLPPQPNPPSRALPPPPPARPAVDARPGRPGALTLGWAFAAVVAVAAIAAGVFVMQEPSGAGATQPRGGGDPAPIDAAIPRSPTLVYGGGSAGDGGSASTAEPMPPVITPPATTVAIKITTTPADATVLLDGKRLGKTPFDGVVDAAPGIHVIKIRRHGYATAKLDVELLGDLTRDVVLQRAD